MDLKSLQIFLSVYSNLSFTQTAAEQHLSVSAVSRSVLRLEDELGERLFDRDRRGMTATSAARRLQTVAERMLAEWRSLQQSLGDKGSLQGELRIFCSVTATHRLLSPLLAAYREAYPAVHLLLQTGDQADGVERVRRGSSDVAVVARPDTLSVRFAFAPLARTSLCLCMPSIDCDLRDRLCALKGDALFKALADVPWILPQRGVSKALVDRWLTGRFMQSPSIYARVAGHEAIVAMVSLGLGVAILPRLVVDASGLENSLSVVDLGHELGPFEIGLCAKQSRLDDPMLQGLWRVAQVLPGYSDRLIG